MRWLGLIAAVGAASLGMVFSSAAAQTVSIAAQGETAPVGTANDDAADDPAIWRNSGRPSASLIVATDKKAGLYVYGLDGKVRSFFAAGRLNNVDLLDMGQHGVIVVASDRNNKAAALLQIYRLDTRKGELVPLGAVSGGAGEAYGVCLLGDGNAVQAFSVLKHGAIHQLRIELTGAAPHGAVLRTLMLATQTEGCVVDRRSKTLYVGEEDRGIWAFDARPAGPVEGRLVAPVDGQHLVADVEGLTLWPQGRRGGFLIASSQGDNAFALFRLPDMARAGRFRIAPGSVGGVEETDGIALSPGRFGRSYPDGLLVLQDGENAPLAQNFKLVSWREVLRALRQVRPN